MGRKRDDRRRRRKHAIRWAREKLARIGTLSDLVPKDVEALHLMGAAKIMLVTTLAEQPGLTKTRVPAWLVLCDPEPPKAEYHHLLRGVKPLGVRETICVLPRGTFAQACQLAQRLGLERGVVSSLDLAKLERR